MSSAPPEFQPGLKPPQFTLRGLFFGLTCCAVLLVTFQVAGPMAASVLILFALAIIAHVAGNSLGTQLRDATDQSNRGTLNPERAQPHHFAQTTRLAERVRLRWPMMVLTGVCSAVASFGGGQFLAKVNAAQATKANLTLAYGSCAVLGAILGFGLSMFLKVTLEAWWQANQAD
jgi:hypothetical protein